MCEEKRLKSILFGKGNEDCLNVEHEMGFVGQTIDKIKELEKRIKTLEANKRNRKTTK